MIQIVILQNMFMFSTNFFVEGLEGGEGGGGGETRNIVLLEQQITRNVGYSYFNKGIYSIYRGKSATEKVQVGYYLLIYL